jgi:hypothetical protein
MSTSLARERVMSLELEILREEYWHARSNPLFDDPKKYCILLDLIIERIELLESKERE